MYILGVQPRLDLVYLCATRDEMIQGPAPGFKCLSPFTEVIPGVDVPVGFRGAGQH